MSDGKISMPSQMAIQSGLQVGMRDGAGVSNQINPGSDTIRISRSFPQRTERVMILTIIIIAALYVTFYAE